MFVNFSMSKKGKIKNLLLIITILLISNCASSFTTGGIQNTGSSITGQDFKYISKVRGEAKSSRILFLVRFDSGDIYSRAMSDISNKVDLYDGSKKGLINVTYDYRYESYLMGIYGKEVVTITADVVEFLD